MQRGTEAIDIGLRRALCLAILFGRGIASGAERNCILRFAGLEVAGNAKINQVDMVIRSEHNIGRFEVAKDNGRLVAVQVIEHRRQLNADIESGLDREAPNELVQVVFQRLAREKVHHHIGSSLLTEVVVNARQVGVHKIGKHQGFMLKGSSGLSHFLRTETIRLISLIATARLLKSVSFAW